MYRCRPVGIARSLIVGCDCVAPPSAAAGLWWHSCRLRVPSSVPAAGLPSAFPAPSSGRSSTCCARSTPSISITSKPPGDDRVGIGRPRGRSDLRQFGRKALSKDFARREIVELLVEHVAPALEEADIAQVRFSASRLRQPGLSILPCTSSFFISEVQNHPGEKVCALMLLPLCWKIFSLTLALMSASRITEGRSPSALTVREEMMLRAVVITTGSEHLTLPMPGWVGCGPTANIAGRRGRDS